MDIANYKTAVAWLRGSLAELERYPDNPILQLGVLHSFEVTHNLSEALLRETYVALNTEDSEANLSLRELIWRAGEEGIVLSSRKQWLQYGLALEAMREAFSLRAPTGAGDASQLLSRFADELEVFARCVERRLVSHG